MQQSAPENILALVDDFDDATNREGLLDYIVKDALRFESQTLIDELLQSLPDRMDISDKEKRKFLNQLNEK